MAHTDVHENPVARRGRDPIDVDDLLAFVTVARLESMSRAADQLNVAQSALSRRVSRLEQDVGHKLLDRHTRGVRLAEAGKLLLTRHEKDYFGIRELLEQSFGIIGGHHHGPSRRPSVMIASDDAMQTVARAFLMATS